jgi:Tfp pilus assembly protein PilF
MLSNDRLRRMNLARRTHLVALALIFFAVAAGSLLYGQTVALPSDCDVRTNAKICARQLYLLVSKGFLQDRDIQKASAGFLQVTQLAPDYAAAWFNLAVIAEQTHDWPNAKARFERYLALAPGGPEAKRSEQELQTLKPYLIGQVTPAKAMQAEYDASIQRARLLLNSQLYREAVSEASHAQSIDDSRWEAYAVVALVMYRQHKDADGHRFADLAIQRSPSDKKETLAKVLVSVP